MTRKFAAAALAAVILSLAAAHADPIEDKELSINGGEVVLPLRAPAPEFLKVTFPEVISGHAYRDPDTRAMQSDDFSNPGMVFVDSGLAAWDAVEGRRQVLRELPQRHRVDEGRARRDAEDERKGRRPVVARELRQQLPHHPHGRRRVEVEQPGNEEHDHGDLDAVARDAGGGQDRRPGPELLGEGKEIYYTRYGQLELACVNCHEQHAGDTIRADHLSQGQINCFPTYRLKDAGMVSIHQRFAGCVRDTRAETFAAGSPEFRALELYVASRGAGLPVEARRSVTDGRSPFRTRAAGWPCTRLPSTPRSYAPARGHDGA